MCCNASLGGTLSVLRHRMAVAPRILEEEGAGAEGEGAMAENPPALCQELMRRFPFTVVVAGRRIWGAQGRERKGGWE